MSIRKRMSDMFNEKRLLKIKESNTVKVGHHGDHLERVLVMGKEADINDLRRNMFITHIRKHKLRVYQGMLNQKLQEGRAYRLQLELKPDDYKRVKSQKRKELIARVDEENSQLKYYARGKIVTDPIRPRGKKYSVGVIDCGIYVHTRMGVTYKKGEWVETFGPLYLSSDNLTKLGDNTVLLKEIDTKINTENGLHLLAVDSHKNLYLAADVHGKKEYLTFKVNYSGKSDKNIDDDMTIPKDSYLAVDDLRKAPKEILSSLGKFNSFVYDEEFVFICDGSSTIKVLKFNGEIEGIKTRSALFFKDYVADKFGIKKHMVK